MKVVIKQPPTAEEIAQATREARRLSLHQGAMVVAERQAFAAVQRALAAHTEADAAHFETVMAVGAARLAFADAEARLLALQAEAKQFEGLERATHQVTEQKGAN